MKKAFEIIKTVLVWLVVIVAVAMMIFTIVSVNTFDQNDRDIFGYKAFIVRSNSMKPEFEAGDLVVVKEVDPTTLKEGDVITFQSQSTASYGEVVTHKIRSLTTNDSGAAGFITYGVNTGTDDDSVVTYSFVLGKYQFAVPKLGTFFNFLKTPQGYIVCILVPFLLLIIYQGLNCVKIFKIYKAEQMSEINKEKEALEEERRKSEAMMAELMALKAQLSKQEGPAEPNEPEQPAEENAEPQQPAEDAAEPDSEI